MSDPLSLAETLLHHVLVVEDNPITTTLLETTLGRRGYSVTSVSGPRAAITLATAQAFDLIITDYNMTPLTGLELAQQILLTGRSPVFLFISGANDEIRSRVLESIADVQFLNKPFSIEGLMLSLQKLAKIAAKKKAL
jgi:CheY-like chemotaxis protein